MFIPVVVMLCVPNDMKFGAQLLVWPEKTRLGITVDYKSEEDAQRLADKLDAVLIAGSYSRFYTDQHEHFSRKGIMFNEYLVADESYNYKHWQLSEIKWKAKKEDEARTQDVHSREYTEWLKERSEYYNNGFYDYAKKNDCKLSSLRAVKACVGKKYKELYSVHEHKHDTYSEMDAWATAVQFGNKYIIYGTGGESCGSDWMNFHLFWVYDTEAEMMETLNKDSFKYSPVKEQSPVSELFQFVSKHNLEEKFATKLV